MSRKAIFLRYLSTGAGTLALLLCVAYFLSLFGEFGWILDLFSHFVVQYFIAAFLLFSLLLLAGRWVFAAFALVLLLASGFELRANVTAARPKGEPAAFTVVQFNKLSRNHNYDQIVEWLGENAESFDLVVLQEATKGTIKGMAPLAEAYPHRVPAKGTALWNDVYILSRHPVSGVEPVKTTGPGNENRGSRFSVHVPGVPEPVEVFTIHAETPLNAGDYAERNAHILSLATAAAQGTSPYRLMIGDWNITPFSPHFANALDISGLRYWHRGLLPTPTWPSFLALRPLQIPIDHVLFGRGFVPLSKDRGPSMGSDHYPLIMTFGVKGKTQAQSEEHETHGHH